MEGKGLSLKYIKEQKHIGIFGWIFFWQSTEVEEFILIWKVECWSFSVCLLVKELQKILTIFNPMLNFLATLFTLLDDALKAFFLVMMVVAISSATRKSLLYSSSSSHNLHYPKRQVNLPILPHKNDERSMSFPYMRFKKKYLTRGVLNDV